MEKKKFIIKKLIESLLIVLVVSILQYIRNSFEISFKNNEIMKLKLSFIIFIIGIIVYLPISYYFAIKKWNKIQDN